MVLTSTHNLCFGAKIRKIGIPLHTPVLLYKIGVQGGIHYTDMFSLCVFCLVNSSDVDQSSRVDGCYTCSFYNCIYMNLNATKCTFGHSDITSRKQQKVEK